MRHRPWILLAALLSTLVVSTFGIGHVFAPPPCDRDHDGYGCNGTTDCNDDDANIHPGAAELCDNKDNDCDALTDEGLGYSSCGIGPCQHVLANCVGGIVPTCNPFLDARPETCNGVDDDCDGQIDDTSSTDVDGDGASPPCDCDDTDPLVNRTALDVCNDGRDQDCNGNVDNLVNDGTARFCATVEPAGSMGVEELSMMTLKAFHTDGVYRVEVRDETTGQNFVDCSSPGSSYCERLVFFSRNNRGLATIKTDVYKPGGAFGILAGTSASQKVDFPCNKEYCKPDPIFGTFAAWMRQQNVPECTLGHTFKYMSPPFREEFLRPQIRQRPKPIPTTPTVSLVDVIATDAGATNQAIDVPDAQCSIGGGPPNCQASADWPSFCPSPVPADTAFLQAKLRQTYGINVTFQYTRRCTNYAQEIGAPSCVNGLCTYPSRNTFESNLNLPAHSIIHYAIQSLNGNNINDLSGGGFNASIDIEPSTVANLAVASHEWGHSWGLMHSFFGPIVTRPRELTPDGVMDNSYLFHQTAGDPLSPMERFILEPTAPEVYTDAATWGQNYVAIQSPSAFYCGPVDPALGTTVTHSFVPGEHRFDLELMNNGTGPVGLVSLKAYDNDLSGLILGDRVVNLDRGESSTYRFTISSLDGAITRGKVLFVLDQPDAITAAAGDVASNNTATGFLDPCVDADGDGYTQDCASCYNAFCPIYDCYDGSALSRPGGVEGPQGSTSCSDGLDNDCDSGTDILDAGCQASADVVRASSELLTQGTKQGDYTATLVANGAYESLTEAGTGTRLIHTWTFTNVQAGTSNDLYVKAFRTGGENEAFKFSFFRANKWVDIPNALVNNPTLEATERVFRFPSLVSGMVQVRITDVTKIGSTPDTVSVDYLAIKTNH